MFFNYILIHLTLLEQVPQQYNSFDCGIYILHYCELLLEEVSAIGPNSMRTLLRLVSALMNLHHNIESFSEVIRYLINILKLKSLILWMYLQIKEDWFTRKDVSRKREKILALVDKLAPHGVHGLKTTAKSAPESAKEATPKTTSDAAANFASRIASTTATSSAPVASM